MCTVSSSPEAISSYVLLRPSRSARATSSTESKRTNPGCLSTRSAGWCCGWGPARRCGSESAETDRSSGRGCWVGREPSSWLLISQSGACSTAGSTRGARTSSPPPRSSLLPPLLCASHRRNPTRILGRPLASECPQAELVPITHPGLPLMSHRPSRPARRHAPRSERRPCPAREAQRMDHTRLAQAQRTRRRRPWPEH